MHWPSSDIITPMKPSGPFDLVNQNQFFNGWPTLGSGNDVIVMTFPVEGWSSCAAVTLQQKDDGAIDLEVYGSEEIEKAKAQALAAMSLDEDGAGWVRVGENDPVIGGLQKQYSYLRPTLFHSPYEAASSFVIGHRISMAQGRAIRAKMSRELGERIEVSGQPFFAFPQPEKILQLKGYPSINEVKMERLHAVAQAALDGLLNRDYLRALDDDTALEKLEQLPGIGPFFSQGILYRGAGKTDGFTRDDMTYHAIKAAYKLSPDSPEQELLDIASRWKPYRMWATVLLHVWARRTGNTPDKRTFSAK